MFQTCKLKAHEIGGGGVEERTKENCPVPVSGGGEVGETVKFHPSSYAPQQK